MGTDITLAVIFVGLPLLGYAFWALYTRSYQAGERAGLKKALASIYVPTKIIRYNTKKIVAVTLVDLAMVRSFPNSEQLSYLVEKKVKDKLWQELEPHITIQKEFDPLRFCEVYQASIFLAKDGREESEEG